jgi:hypothetical protein
MFENTFQPIAENGTAKGDPSKPKRLLLLLGIASRDSQEARGFVSRSRELPEDQNESTESVWAPAGFRL